jgi:prepilin-type processing-associated H-X9-DG protein
VRGGQIRKSAETILAAEWNADWNIVADAGRATAGTLVCKSHRPVHAFVGLGNTNPNIDQIAPDVFGNRPTYERVKLNQLSANPQVGSNANTTPRLDWIGRNHGRKRIATVKGIPGTDERKTNFLYADGHVETKHVFETLSPFQWGERFYSLRPDGGLVLP